MSKTYQLYNGEVILDFDPDARYRYKITDKANGLDKQAVPGVTTVLGNVFDKPGLRAYPLNMAMSYLFGARWDNVLKKHVVDIKKTKEITPILDLEEEVQELLDQCYAASKDKAQAGRDTGTDIHKAIEMFLQWRAGETETIPVAATNPEVEKAYKAFTKWYLDQPNIKPLKVEQPVYSRSKRYAGTFDSILEINGKIHLVDIKTTNVSSYALRKGKDWTGIYPENFLQLGAYSLAYREEDFEINGRKKTVTDMPIEDLTVINVTKDGKLFVISSKADLGIDVSEWETQAENMMKAHDILARTKKVKPVEVGKYE